MGRKVIGHEKAIEIWEYHYGSDQQAKCSYCHNDMSKAQHCGVQGGDCWNIDHRDGNPDNNDINNLWPMHKSCNEKKK